VDLTDPAERKKKRCLLGRVQLLKHTVWNDNGLEVWPHCTFEAFLVKSEIKVLGIAALLYSTTYQDGSCVQFSFIYLYSAKLQQLSSQGT